VGKNDRAASPYAVRLPRLRLILDDAVPAYGIDVDVDRGKVTLCGAVDFASERSAAERIALRVPGVSEVRNRLKVW